MFQRLGGILAPWLLALRHRLVRCIDACLPPSLLLYEQATAQMSTQALRALCTLGIAQAICRTSATVQSLAEKTKTQPQYLARLLSFCATRNWVRIDRSGVVHPTRLTHLLTPQAAGSMAPFTDYFGHPDTVAACTQLAHLVTFGGDPYERAHGQPVWQHFAAHPEQEATFAQAMRSLTALEAPAIVRAAAFAHSRRICDIGGGTGTLLAGLLTHLPAATGTLYDLPSVVARAPETLSGFDTQRLKCVGGDFFASIPGGHDTYVLRNILHDWDDEAAVRLLGRVREAMGPGDRLIVVEMPVGGPAQPLTTLVDLVMLIATSSGRQRTQTQLDALLLRARLKSVARTPLPTCSDLVVAQAL